MPQVSASQLREGMQVYSGEGQHLGEVEQINQDSITVRGQQYELNAIERVEENRVRLTRQVGATVDTGVAADSNREQGGMAARGEVVEAQGEIRVPEIEERLHVEKRPVELGEVRIEKRVTEEQQTVPVELSREEVHVDERDTEDRPATEADLRGAFEEGTIRVPVRGEEAVVSKEAVVTGEVVINKERTTDREEVTDTVRRVRVEVDEAYQRDRDRFRQHYAQNRGASGQPPFEEAEHTYRTGYMAAHDERYAGKRFEDVEPELRREHERSASGAAGDSAGGGRGGDDQWARLREEVREGFQRARGQ